MTERDGVAGAASARSRRRLVITLVLLGSLRLVFPGDVPFINDEALIVENALEANEAGTLVAAGLVGTRGAQYGPLPTWFYQLGLTLTNELRWIALAKAVLVTALTGLALVRLAGALVVVPWLGTFAFLSPYLWFYARDLWDNSFIVPLAALALAGYATFLRDGRVAPLALAALAGTLGVMTHFMIAPLVAAIALHFAVTQAGRLAREPRFAVGVAAVATGCLALAIPYLSRIPGGSLTSFLLSPSVRSLAFAADGMRIFTVIGFDYVIGPWRLGGVGPVVATLTAFSYAVGAYGLYLCFRWQRAPEPTPRKRIAEVLLLALLLFVLVANGKRLAEHPHYYSGVWVVFFAVWWLGMSELWTRVWVRRALVVQGGIMTAFLVGVMAWIHVNEGSRALHYGPTLANQVEVARALELRGVEGMPVSTAHHPRLFPHAIGVLRRLERARGVEAEAGPEPADAYEIVYVEPDGFGGAIVLRRVE